MLFKIGFGHGPMPSLFLKYMLSNQVEEALGQQGVSQLKDFYCKRIEPHEDLFVF
jgi:hypothetical protein